MINEDINMKVQKFEGRPISGPKPGLVHWFIWAFFGNELDGPIGDSKWNPERKDNLWIRLKWWFRNPCHNFTWHVIGFAHKNTTRYDESDNDVPGWNKAWSVVDDDPKQRKYPFRLYIGKTWTFYAGWRGRGTFGLKFNRTK